MWSRTADVDRYSMGVFHTAIVIPQNSSEVVVASCEQRLRWEHSTYGNAICSMKGISIFWEKLFCRKIYAFDKKKKPEVTSCLNFWKFEMHYRMSRMLPSLGDLTGLSELQKIEENGKEQRYVEMRRFVLAGADGVLNLISPHSPNFHLDFNEKCNHCS